MSERLPGVNWQDFEPYLRGDHDPNGANMDAPTINLPYRIASEINEHVIREAERTGYILGDADREDAAYDYTLRLIEQNAVSDHTVAFNGLFLWRRIYGNFRREGMVVSDDD